MTPDQLKIQELETQVADMRRLLDGLVNAAQVDPNVARTLGTILTGTSSKTAASATQAVNESGAASYSVMKAPDGFVTIAGVNVPYIN